MTRFDIQFAICGYISAMYLQCVLRYRPAEERPAPPKVMGGNFMGGN